MIKRLAELIRQAEQECSEMKICSRCEQYGRGGDCQRLKISNHLLENGVIVSPCKVGDTVYCKDGAWVVVGFDCNRVNRWAVKLERWRDRFRDCHERKKVAFSSFGKTVFLTRKEAEKALERSEE